MPIFSYNHSVRPGLPQVSFFHFWALQYGDVYAGSKSDPQVVEEAGCIITRNVRYVRKSTWEFHHPIQECRTVHLCILPSTLHMVFLDVSHRETAGTTSYISCFKITEVLSKSFVFSSLNKAFSYSGRLIQIPFKLSKWFFFLAFKYFISKKRRILLEKQQCLWVVQGQAMTPICPIGPI